jgi:hypothetical protein
MVFTSSSTELEDSPNQFEPKELAVKLWGFRQSKILPQASVLLERWLLEERIERIF